MSFLTIENLNAEVGPAPILRDVSLSVAAGEVRGLVGESGAGKSMIGKAVLGTLPSAVKISSGRIVLDGEDLQAMRPRDRRRLAASVDTSSGVTVAARAVSTSDSSETAIYAVTVVVDDGRFHGTKDGMSIMITGYAHEDDTYITDTTFHALETAGGGFESGDTYSFSVATDVNIALITSITLTSSGASHRKQSPRCRFARETRSRKAIDDQTTV